MPDATPEAIVTTPAQLKPLVDHLRATGRFAFDTEFVSEETFEPVLCLIQVATHERLVVIDPLAVRDLGPFWDVVCDPSVQVVMHAAGEDLRICLLRTGSLPRRVFDVQIAAGLVGLNYPLSLVNLVGQVLGKSLAGSETRTDWRHRPLSAAQLHYALDDVRYLLDLADHFTDRLTQLGRMVWAEAEFDDFIESIAQRAEEDRWRRLPGLNQMSRRSLEMARQLALWREDEARRQNRPLRHLIRDDLLAAIAKRQPRNRRDLEALRDFNRPALLNRCQEILAILDQARAVPEDGLPELPARPEEPAGLSTVTNLLSAALAQCCVQNQLAGSLVANVADLKHLVRWHSDGRDDSHRPALLQGWRGQLCGRLLLDVLEGRLALRVVDPESEFPVALEQMGPTRPGSS
jgi:ribonuclease D